MLDLSRKSRLPFVHRTLFPLAAAYLLVAGVRVLPAAEVPSKPAAHPIIPGFERFYTVAGADAVKGGQLLLSELNCLSCHRSDAKSETLGNRKQAPVLDGLAGRVKKGYLKKFLSDPQAVKPGTAMPNVFAGLSEQERQQHVEALVHFLATTGVLKQERPVKKAVAAGRDLYSKVGCIACHGTRDAVGNSLKLFATSVPLPDVKAKYVLSSLRTFLENPHAARPSGRMPRLLNAKEAQEVANYLLQGATALALTPNMHYTYYEGNWAKLPEFAKLKAKAKGQSNGFDLSFARRTKNMAMRFEGYLRIDRDGDYHFHLHSDDGSKLWIDDKLAVSNDGIHAPVTQSGKVHLTKGTHKLTAAVFNAGGGVEMSVDINGPGLGRQDVAPFLSLTADGNAPPTVKSDNKDDDFTVNPELVEKGRVLFTGIGCASCHQLNLGKQTGISSAKVTPLHKLRPAGGCLDKAPAKGVPWYALSQVQRTALAAALETPAAPEPATPADLITRTMITFNCYACHERQKIGGVQQALNPFFITTQPEMGEEGRLPPPLDGIGAKLNLAYFNEVLDKGAHDRPYMLTRMPGFGKANVGHLPQAFAALDTIEPVPAVTFTEPPTKVKSAARHMVGAQGLGCIKCHTFAGHKAEGVQGIDMTLMPKRVTRDWFIRYLLDPQKFRPGTRMPAAWFNGMTALPKVLSGDTPKQVESIWVYLSDGTKALLPLGLKKKFIPLEPLKEAIIYRNFIEGAGPRGIAVGYPEHANLAFDANELRLALLWQGGFMDASRHWTDRGVGFEPPLGDNILHLPAGVSFAVLPKGEGPWPKESARQLGYHFRGYRLSPDQRPTFLYSMAGAQIEDHPEVVTGKSNPSLKRTLTVTAPQPAKDLWFRAVVADKIETLGEGRYRINGEWTLRIEASAAPRLRQSGGKTELLVPVRFQDGRARIVEEFVW